MKPRCVLHCELADSDLGPVQRIYARHLFALKGSSRGGSLRVGPRSCRSIQPPPAVYFGYVFRADGTRRDRVAVDLRLRPAADAAPTRIGPSKHHALKGESGKNDSFMVIVTAKRLQKCFLAENICQLHCFANCLSTRRTTKNQSSFHQTQLR
jgi:hypothetical protein